MRFHIIHQGLRYKYTNGCLCKSWLQAGIVSTYRGYTSVCVCGASAHSERHGHALFRRKSARPMLRRSCAYPSLLKTTQTAQTARSSERVITMLIGLPIITLRCTQPITTAQCRPLPRRLTFTPHRLQDKIELKF